MIELLHLEDLNAKEISERILKVCNAFSPLIRIIRKRWVTEFKRDHTSLEDDPRQRRLKQQYRQKSEKKCRISYWKIDE